MSVGVFERGAKWSGSYSGGNPRGGKPLPTMTLALIRPSSAVKTGMQEAAEVVRAQFLEVDVGTGFEVVD